MMCRVLFYYDQCQKDYRVEWPSSRRRHRLPFVYIVYIPKIVFTQYFTQPHNYALLPELKTHIPLTLLIRNYVQIICQSYFICKIVFESVLF